MLIQVTFSALSSEMTVILVVVFMMLTFGIAGKMALGAIKRNQQIERRLAGGGTFDISAPPLNRPGLLETLGAHLTLPDAKEITLIRHTLTQAGYYKPASIKVYYAIRLLCILVPQIIILLSWGHLRTMVEINLVVRYAIILAGIGFFAPPYFLKWKQKHRTLQSKEGFPDMMDLMVSCIEAGLSLDAALIRVGQEIGNRYPALKVNLDLMNLELRAGRDRHIAMMSFAERVNIEEAKALAVILRQSEEMGSSMATTLRVFSDDMRAKRMLLAEEKAAALSAKLTIPLMIFIFPTLMVILLLPSGIRIANGFF